MAAFSGNNRNRALFVEWDGETTVFIRREVCAYGCWCKWQVLNSIEDHNNELLKLHPTFAVYFWGASS